MLKGTGWRKGQECAHSWLKNHPLGFVGRGKVSAQLLWPGMEARVRKNDGTLEAPSVQAVDTDGTYKDREGTIRKAILNRLRFGKDAQSEGVRTNKIIQSEAGHNASWTKSGATVGSGDDINAVGITLNKLVSDNLGGFRSILQNQGSVPAGQHIIFSVYVQDGTEPETAIRVQDPTNTHKVTVPISWDAGGAPNAQAALPTGDFVHVETIIEPQSDGITYRIILIVKNNNAGALSVRWLYYVRWDEAGNTGDYTYAGGFQGELTLSAFASSYTPTTTVAATRSGDDLAYDKGSITPTTPFTMMLSYISNFDRAALRSGVDGAFPGIWTMRHSSGGLNGFNLHANYSGDSLSWSTWLNGSTTGVTISLALVRGIKYIFMVTWNGVDTTEGFLNGVTKGINAASSVPANLPADYRVGMFAATADHCWGGIAHVAITESVLSVRQVENANAVIRKVA